MDNLNADRVVSNPLPSDEVTAAEKKTPLTEPADSPRSDKPVSDIELAKLEIERGKLEIEMAKLEIEKKKDERERGFLNKNSGSVITAVISFAAIIVSVAQVWVSQIAKDKELTQLGIQKRMELDKLDEQKKREMDLSLAKFVMENRTALFNGTPEEKDVFAKMISTMFPPDFAVSLFTRLETTSSPKDNKPWTAARERILQVHPEASAPSPPQYVPPQSAPQPATNKAPVRGRIIHNETGAGASYTDVTITNSAGRNFSTMTDDKGNFTIVLPLGTYKHLKASYRESLDYYQVADFDLNLSLPNSSAVDLGSIKLAFNGSQSP